MNEVSNIPKMPVSLKTLIYPAIASLIVFALYSVGVFLPAAIVIGLLSIFLIVYARITLRGQEYERWLAGLGQDAPPNNAEDAVSIMGAIPFNNRVYFTAVTVNAKGIIFESKKHKRYIAWDEMLSAKRVMFQGKHNLQLKLYQAAPYNLINIPWDKSANNYAPSRWGL